MVNKFSQATVSPVIPVDLVSDFELVLLEGHGFMFQAKGSKGDRSYYFRLPLRRKGFFSDLGLGLLDLIEECAKQGDEIALELRQYILEKGLAGFEEHVSSQYSWPSLFQRILNKPGCLIDEIVVEGAYIGGELIQGEFGGWITRITRFSVQNSNTQEMLIQMQQESAFLEALGLVYQLADANCADNEHDPEDPLLDESLAENCRKQRAALDLIHNYCVNHKLTK